MLRLGAHLSIAKGLDAAARMAAEVGANTFQFFTRNPRGGAARAIPAHEVRAWLRRRVEQDLYPIVGHLPYTVNLAAPNEPVHAFARDCLREDLRRAAAFGAEYLVVHPGSHLGDGPEAALERIAGAVGHAFEGFAGETVLLLETMAGQGSEVGGELVHVSRIMERLGDPPWLGVCVDSCHLFAAGYDLRDGAGMDRLVADLEATVGLARVRVVHLNDSKMPCSSRRDRHAPIGQGQLGERGIRAVVSHPVLGRLPLLLETPVEDYREYAAEIERVLALARG